MQRMTRVLGGSCVWALLPWAVACGSSNGGPSVTDGGLDAHDGGMDASRDAKHDAADAHDAAKDAPHDAAHDADAGPTCPTGDASVALSTDPATFAEAPKSCGYGCPLAADCAEATAGYVCPSMGDWGCLPHAPVCGDWDGTYPKVTTGKCTASAPSGDAAKYTGVDPDDATLRILPDGRRMKPAGSVWMFNEPDLQGDLTTGILGIPGTTYVVTIDDGTDQHAMRLIDTARIAGGTTPVLSYIRYQSPITLNSGIAFRAPDLILVPTANGTVQAITYDSTALTIANDATRSLTMPPGSGSNQYFYGSAVAVSPDGTKAVVTSVTDTRLLVFDIGAGSATYGTMLGVVDLPTTNAFAAAFDPSDASGTTVYVSMWGGKEVLAVDVSNPALPVVSATYPTGKDPEGMAFLNSRFMVVANDLGDSLSVIDRTAGTVTSVSTLQSDGFPGVEPVGMAFDPVASRLYVPLAAANAVAAYSVDLTATPPAIVPAGRLPTSWWPSGVALLADGSVAVASMQGNGSGPDLMQFDIGSGDIGDLMRSGIQIVPTPSESDLTSGDALVTTLNDVAGLAGAPTVTCPTGAADFPLPATNTEGPSPVIKHVFLFIRENKSFDGLFGDFPNVNGEPAYTLKTLTGEMDVIWANLRSLARTFTMSDNFYTDAVYSTQGHMWDTYGRTDDFDERTWVLSGDGRSVLPFPGAGVADVGKPVEGSVFDWLGNNMVDYDILGEIVGGPAHPPTPSPIDLAYPGGAFQDIFYNDDEKACHIAGRARVECNFASFVYATLPNDHTQGVATTNPAPETYCAVNDDATGMAIDAITHSPIWASSLIFITEDDPSQGGEHVDSHRSPIVVISPWVKRGYVSKTHIDVPSLHKMFAHVFGKPYPNTMVAHAGLPLDMFTSTPDYTPYTYVRRTFPLYCGKAVTQAEQRLTSSWDFEEADEQPGLDRQVMRYMRGKQLEKLTRQMEREVEERWEKKVREHPPEVTRPAEAGRGSARPKRGDDDD
jgi:DNA-binding beta-propeller fold protein YncE